MACQDYILYAKARGFGRRHIFFKEIMPGLIQVLEGDLTKVTLIVLSNLFIAERLFILSGITTFLFHYGFQKPNIFGGGYQFNIVVNCLIYLFLLFFIVRTGLKLLLLLIRKWGY
jgi:peptide/nickel transport system permease protein